MSRSSKKKHRIVKNSQGQSIKISSCRDLVWIDSAPLKEKEQKKCQALQEKIDAARIKINVHETVSAPEYQKWLHSNFGKQLSEIRELSQQLFEKQQIIEAVFTESYLSGCSKRQAYQNVMKKKTRAEARSNHSEDEDECQSEKDEDSFSEEPHESHKQSKKEKADQEKADFRGHHRPNRESLKTEPLQTEGRVKELYRQLVRKLHPDLNPNLELKKRDLWHQVQEAYQSHQVERLEALSTLNDLWDGSWERVAEVSALKGLFKNLMASLNQLEKKIGQARRDPAWRFQEVVQKPAQLKCLKISLTRKLSAAFQELLEQQEEIETILEEWNTPYKKGKKRKGGRVHETSRHFNSLAR